MCTDASLSQVNGLTARAARARVVAEMTTNWERHYVHFVDVDVRDVYLAQMSEPPKPLTMVMPRLTVAMTSTSATKTRVTTRVTTTMKRSGGSDERS